MTLVIATKIDNEISYTTDSRLSYSDKTFIDFGVKLFKIPVSISTFGTMRSNPEEIYKRIWGMAIAGSHINCIILKDMIQQILSNLKLISGNTFNMDDICAYILEIFKASSKEVLAVFRERGTGIFLIGGFDTGSNRIRHYIFYHDFSNDKIGTYFKEVELDNGAYLSFGSAKDLVASEKYKNLRGLEIMSQILSSTNDVSIGGNIQHGRFDKNGNFDIFSVQSPVYDEDGILIQVNRSLLSFSYKEDNLLNSRNFYPSSPSVTIKK